MRNNRKKDDYEIGYGKPPTSGQFKRGFSGNPLGRPKKSPDFESELVRQLNSKVPIQEQGKRRILTKYEVMARQLVNKAIAGNVRELRLLIALMPQAFERVAELVRPVRAEDLTDDQLAAIILRGESAMPNQNFSNGRRPSRRAKLQLPE